MCVCVYSVREIDVYIYLSISISIATSTYIFIYIYTICTYITLVPRVNPTHSRLLFPTEPRLCEDTLQAI